MIGYVTVGTNNLETSSRFYDAIFAEIGATRFWVEERFIVWATEPEKSKFCLIKPYDGEPATVGNGVMVAFEVSDPSLVDALHNKSIDLGGKDEGLPGNRGEHFYGAYVRDLDGNKLYFFTSI
ncbi:VOC family protein [Pseudoalteromonas sp. DL2-H2.2]|uniref:VOC family protein n=1 Tax=Pseudoalteromonas sp. DL2-H2.2 TaxID=2908889 RepID=UPI001F25FE2A|nr:VOC family protein [Pseudoalteromonas sp. DL2-H2.2]MCF2909353.1 VOC family protein [Pseudoalteromonas sp. DL2-H2.2]